MRCLLLLDFLPAACILLLCQKAELIFAKTSPGNTALGECPASTASVQMAVLVGNAGEPAGNACGGKPFKSAWLRAFPLQCMQEVEAGKFLPFKPAD